MSIQVRQLSYEKTDAEGAVVPSTIELTLRIPTGQAREEVRAAIAGYLKEYNKLNRQGAAIDAVRNPLLVAAEQQYPTIEEKIAAEEKADEMEDAVYEHRGKMGALSDRALHAQLRASVTPACRALLTDEILATANIEEMQEIVNAFQRRVGLGTK